MKITFRIQDSVFFGFSDNHLGGYEIDLTSVYFNKNHMYLKTWFTLFDFEEQIEGCIGYVKATIEVLGPDDKPTITESITDDPSIEKTVISKKIRPRGHLIMAEIYKAEFLSPINMTTRSVDPYVRIKYGGMQEETQKIKDNSNPEFNQIIFLPALLPNHSKDVFIELWHGAFFADSLIGTAKFSFNKFKDSNNSKPMWINIYGPPLTSHNKYSILMAKNGYSIGSTFRGRILLRFSSRDENSPNSKVIHMRYNVPRMIIPNPMSKMYTLRIDVFEGSALPTKKKGMLHFCLGPYLFKSSLKEQRNNTNNIFWNESIKERRINLPLDISQIPDLIVYFCNEDVESRRVSYSRKKAEKFVIYNTKTFEKNQKAMIIKFKEDKSHKLVKDDQFPGFALIRVVLFAHTPPPRKQNLIIKSNNIEKVKYILKLFVYVARDLASGEDNGTSNPQVSFRVGGVEKTTKCKPKTLNPNFYEVIDIDISMDKNQNASPPTLIIFMNHIEIKEGETADEYDENNKKTLIGRFWLKLEVDKKKNKKFMVSRKDNKGIDLIYEKPQWIPLIYDKEDKEDGKLLMGYTLTKKENEVYLKDIEIKPDMKKEEMAIWAFGVRGLNFTRKMYKYNPFNQFRKQLPDNITYDIFIDGKAVENLKKNSKDKDKKILTPEENRLILNKNKKKKTEKKNNIQSQIAEKKLNTEDRLKTNKIKIEEQGITINCEGSMLIEIPKNKELCPIMEIFIYEYVNGKPSLVGIGQCKLSKPLAYFYKKQEDKHYIKKWNDFFNLDKIQEKNAIQKKHRIKIQKFKPENKMIYFEDLVYEIKTPVNIKKLETDKGDIKNFANVEIRNELEDDKEVRKKNDPNRNKLTLRLKQLNKNKLNINETEEEIKETKDEDKKDIPLLSKITGVEFEEDKDTQKNPLIEKKNIINQDDEKKLLLNVSDIVKDDMNTSKDFVSQEISNFNLNSSKNLENLSGDLSKKDLQFDQLFVDENKDAKIKKKKEDIDKFLFGLRKKNPFEGLFKKKKKTIEYQDFNTDEDEEEDLDDVLPYLKGRKEYQVDLEEEIFKGGNNKIVDYVEIYQGNLRQKKTVKKRKIGTFKFLFARKKRNDLVAYKKIRNFLQTVSKTKSYKARVYILRGLQIIGLKKKNQGIKTFIKSYLNGKEQNQKEEDVKEGLYPEYYRVHEFSGISIPGTALLRIEIWEKTDLTSFSKDLLVGYTEIDLEERHFSINWNNLEMKPVEKRNIQNDLYDGSRGNLEMWIDIIPEQSRKPRTIIYPKLQLPYELRVIVWETKDCVFKDELTSANDLYARGGVMRGQDFLETDTHWRCRNKGSFNWRWKFDINLPVDENKNYGEDQFIIQLWDRDLIASNDLIGSFQIDLNTHKMLKKAHFRKKAVEMKLRIKGNGNETNMIWFNVYHPSKIDEKGNKIFQGRVCCSFEVLPKELADKFDNGIGRAVPNFFPTLPLPVGRFSFDIFSPCKTLKAIIGPKAYYKCCYWIFYIIFMFVLVFVGYYILTTYLGVVIAI